MDLKRKHEHGRINAREPESSNSSPKRIATEDKGGKPSHKVQTPRPNTAGEKYRTDIRNNNGFRREREDRNISISYSNKDRRKFSPTLLVNRAHKQLLKREQRSSCTMLEDFNNIVDSIAKSVEIKRLRTEKELEVLRKERESLKRTIRDGLTRKGWDKETIETGKTVKTIVCRRYCKDSKRANKNGTSVEQNGIRIPENRAHIRVPLVKSLMVDKRRMFSKYTGKANQNIPSTNKEKSEEFMRSSSSESKLDHSIFKLRESQNNIGHSKVIREIGTEGSTVIAAGQKKRKLPESELVEEEGPSNPRGSSFKHIFKRGHKTEGNSTPHIGISKQYNRNPAIETKSSIKKEPINAAFDSPRITKVSPPKIRLNTPVTLEGIEDSIDSFIDRNRKIREAQSQEEGIPIFEPLELKKEMADFRLKCFHSVTKYQCKIQHFFKALATDTSGRDINTDTRTSSFIIFFYRIEGNAPEIYNLTTGQNWRLAEKIACEEFPDQIASGMLKREFTFFELHNIGGGPDHSTAVRAKAGRVISPETITSTIQELNKRKAEVMPSFKSIKGLTKPGLKFYVTKKAIKIEAMLDFSQMQTVFQCFSTICNKIVEYDSAKSQIKNHAVINDLNKLLEDVFRKKNISGHASGITLEPENYKTWEKAEDFSLSIKYEGKLINKKLIQRPPNLDEVLDKLEKLHIPESRWLESNGIRVKASDEKYRLTELIDKTFLRTEHGVPKFYLYRFGKWFLIQKDYLKEQGEAIVQVFRQDFLTSVSEESLPLLPWKHVLRKSKNTRFSAAKGVANTADCTTFIKKHRGEKFIHINPTLELKIDINKIKEMDNVSVGEETDNKISFDYNVTTFTDEEHLGALLFLRMETELYEKDYNNSHVILQRFWRLKGNERFIIIPGDRQLTENNIELYDILISDELENRTYIVHVKVGFNEIARVVCDQIKNSAKEIYTDLLNRCNSLKQYYSNVTSKHPDGDILQRIGETKFLELFTGDSRELVFVYACRDTTKKRVLECLYAEALKGQHIEISSASDSTIALWNIIETEKYIHSLWIGERQFKFKIFDIPISFI